MGSYVKFGQDLGSLPKKLMNHWIRLIDIHVCVLIILVLECFQKNAIVKNQTIFKTTLTEI